MASYESLMKGTIYGAGDCTRGSRHSVLSMMVEDRLNTSVRPPQHLTKKEIAILRLWVDQGARKTNPSPGNVRFREDSTHHQRLWGRHFAVRLDADADTNVLGSQAAMAQACARA